MTESLEPGIDLIDIRKSLRGRYRGFVLDVENGQSLLQTSTSYDTPEEAFQALRKGFLSLAFAMVDSTCPVCDASEDEGTDDPD